MIEGKPRLERDKQSHVNYTLRQALSKGEGASIRPYYDLYCELSEEAQREIDDLCATLLESVKQRNYGRSKGMGETSAFWLVMHIMMAASVSMDYHTSDIAEAWNKIDWQKVEAL